MELILQTGLWEMVNFLLCCLRTSGTSPTEERCNSASERKAEVGKKTSPTVAANYFLLTPEFASGRKGCCVLMPMTPAFHLQVSSVKL